jgi:hypothetical protein
MSQENVRTCKRAVEANNRRDHEAVLTRRPALDAPASAAFDDQRAFIERDSGQPGDDVLAIAFESGVDLVPFAE